MFVVGIVLLHRYGLYGLQRGFNVVMEAYFGQFIKLMLLLFVMVLDCSNTYHILSG